MRNCFWQCCNLVKKAFVVERLIFSLVQNLLHNHQTALAENYYYHNCDAEKKGERREFGPVWNASVDYFGFFNLNVKNSFLAQLLFILVVVVIVENISKSWSEFSVHLFNFAICHVFDNRVAQISQNVENVLDVIDKLVDELFSWLDSDNWKIRIDVGRDRDENDHLRELVFVLGSASSTRNAVDCGCAGKLELKTSAESEDLEAESNAGRIGRYVVANLTSCLRDGNWKFYSCDDSAVVDDLDAWRGLGSAVLNWLDETVAERHAVNARHHICAGCQLNVNSLTDDVIHASRVWNAGR